MNRTPVRAALTLACAGIHCGVGFVVASRRRQRGQPHQAREHDHGCCCGTEPAGEALARATPGAVLAM